MERKGFFQMINQRKQLELKKLSLESKSSNVNRNIENSMRQIQTPTYNAQLPSFINRKVKNLKPYTTHFKKFNLVHNKIPDNLNKNTNRNLNKNNTDTNHIFEKRNIIRNQNNRQVMILPDSKLEFANKISQISVYQQFLQKTNSTFSSFFQQFKQTSKNIKNKINFNAYDNNRKNKLQQQKNLFPQRRSLGTKEIQNQKQKFQTIKQRSNTRSVNNLSRNQQGKQSTIAIKNQDKKQSRSIFQGDKIQQKNNSIDFQSLYVNNQFKIISSEIAIFTKQKQTTKSSQYSHNIDLNLNQLKRQNKKYQSSTLQPNFSLKNNQIRYKFSPQKNNQKLVKNLKKYPQFKDIRKKFSQPPLSVKNRAYKQKSNNKIQVQTINQVNLPPNITAFSYIIYEPSFSQNPKVKLCEDNLKSNNKIFSNSKIIASVNCKTVVQMASLTKIMTFIVALEITQKFTIKQQQEKIRIGKFQSNINGTSAQIQQGQIYTLEQLFYGLMLPSGNDASLAIAIWGGKKLLISEIKQKLSNKKRPSQVLFSKQSQNDLLNSINNKDKKIVLKKKRCYERFILQMNKKARFIGMSKTNYANSHGLANNLNKSCGYDLALLCQYVMKNEKFKKVVSTINYSGTIQAELIVQNQATIEKNLNKSQKQCLSSGQNKQKTEVQNQKYLNDYQQHQNEHFDQQSSQQLQQKDENKEGQIKIQKILIKKQINWQNTHKLLSKEQYIGIKTGITNTAGPCLASCIKTSDNRFFIIIVLNSKKISYRFKDTQTLKKWLFKKQKIIKNQSLQNNKIQNLQIPLTSQLKYEINENQI